MRGMSSVLSTLIVLLDKHTHPVLPTVLIPLEIGRTHALVIVVGIQTLLGGITFLKKRTSSSIRTRIRHLEVMSQKQTDVWQMSTVCEFTSMHGFMSWLRTFLAFLSMWICTDGQYKQAQFLQDFFFLLKTQFYFFCVCMCVTSYFIQLSFTALCWRA